jgi:hypothetical protein
MVRYLKKVADAMTEMYNSIQAQESDNIVKTRHLPEYQYIRPIEGSLISIGDIRDLT